MQAYLRAQFAKCSCCLAFYFPALRPAGARLDWLRPARGSSDSHDPAPKRNQALRVRHSPASAAGRASQHALTDQVGRVRLQAAAQVRGVQVADEGHPPPAEVQALDRVAREPDR
eukprot:7693147-Heterocapsa_arctica.AAC.1